MEAKGLHSRNGGPISPGNFKKLLRPSYAGRFRFGGREYAGLYEPFVSGELFWAAHRIPDGRRGVKTKRPSSNLADRP